MISKNALTEKFNPIKKLTDYTKYKLEFAKIHPDYFYPDGLTCFVGPQGTGKTLSAVNYVYNLLNMYPKSILVTNLLLKDYPIVTFEDFIQSNESYKIINKKLLFQKYKKENRVFPFNNNDDLMEYNNGEYGVIFLIDEIQLYLNSLESKNINLDVVTQISQQRKQRKHIVCTSQVFGRMAKPLREQFSSIVLCKNYFGWLQKNQLIDRDSIDNNGDDMHISGKVIKTYWYIHTPDYYNRYNTYYVIERNKFISNEKKGVDIYGNQLSSST